MNDATEIFYADGSSEIVYDWWKGSDQHRRMKGPWIGKTSWSFKKVYEPPFHGFNDCGSAEFPDVVRRIADTDFSHVDSDPFVEWDDNISEADFLDWLADQPNDNVDDENATDEAKLWFPRDSDVEPQLSLGEMETLDLIADQIEVQRLQKMEVLQREDELPSGSELGSPLTAKMVRTWRQKEREVDGKLEQMWYRRSRLVAREYNFLEERTDCYAPGSSAMLTRLLPILKVTNTLGEDYALAAADISDAYLMVDQKQKRKIQLVGSSALPTNADFYIARCLPGQRDGARRWYDHFRAILEAELGATACLECPSLFRGVHEGKTFCILVHVDDVLILGSKQWISDVAIHALSRAFKLTYHVMSAVGDEVSFLKKKYTLTERGIVVTAPNSHCRTLVEEFAKANGRPAKKSKIPCSNDLFIPDDSDLLDEWFAGKYRSLVGLGLYIAQDRWDLVFGMKSLAAFMKTPTARGWEGLEKIVGYVANTLDFNQLLERQAGDTFMSKLFGGHPGAEVQLEAYTDSDWMGSWLKSTSGAVQTVNGIPLSMTSRTQKVVSLSSTEAELYAATSGTVDTLFIKHCLEFLLPGRIKIKHTLHVDNSAVRQLCQKLGGGRLRHVHGKLLWLQTLTHTGGLEIRQVSTTLNPSDAATKPLTRARHLALLNMLGFHSGVEEVGKNEMGDMFEKHLKRIQARKNAKTVAGNRFLEVMQIMFAGNLLQGGAACFVSADQCSADEFSCEPNSDFDSSFHVMTHWSFICTALSLVTVFLCALLVWFACMLRRICKLQDAMQDEMKKRHCETMRDITELTVMCDSASENIADVQGVCHGIRLNQHSIAREVEKVYTANLCHWNMMMGFCVRSYEAAQRGEVQEDQPDQNPYELLAAIVRNFSEGRLSTPDFFERMSELRDLAAERISGADSDGR